MIPMVKVTFVFLMLSLSSIFNAYASNTNIKEYVISTTGVFKVKFRLISTDEIDAGRMVIDKNYSGGLIGTGIGQMLSKRTTVENSAVYVAIEEFTGTVDGHQGSFSFYHLGVMDRGDNSLDVKIIPDSGTGKLTGISGSLEIIASEGSHSYVLNYEIKP